MDYTTKILPFYMTYPMQNDNLIPEEDTVLRDLEYLQQMYPVHARKIQKRVAEVMDKMDYDGSLLYDEYRDKLQLYCLGDSIEKILKKEDGMEDVNSDMVQLVLYYEMYKRRQERRRCYFRF